MSKELMLFYNADGKWAVYDDTFDILPSLQRSVPKPPKRP